MGMWGVGKWVVECGYAECGYVEREYVGCGYVGCGYVECGYLYMCSFGTSSQPCNIANVSQVSRVYQGADFDVIIFRVYGWRNANSNSRTQIRASFNT